MTEKKEDVKAEEKKKALTDYEKMLEDVRNMKVMTDTGGWQKFVRGIHNSIAMHADAVLEAEKPREVVQHQVGVKLLRHILKFPAEPVETMQSFVRAMPLFAQDMKVRARYNPDLGTIELSEKE